MASERQEILDTYYHKHGPCCAGCDWWRSVTSLDGECNGIALTPDRTSALWFWSAWSRADAVLFTRKLRFFRPDGSEGVSPSNGTALFAAGDRASAALSRASRSGFGILAMPLAPRPVAGNERTEGGAP